MRTWTGCCSRWTAYAKISTRHHTATRCCRLLFPATTTPSSCRSHYSYSGPGTYDHDHHHHDHPRDFKQRGFTVGIGGPVGSGKTSLVWKLCQQLPLHQPSLQLGVVTNDIFTQEDAEFLVRQQALAPKRIRAVETGGCPHAAIREDISANLSALEDLTREIRQETKDSSPNSSNLLLLCESGGDNLAANFSPDLADLTLYVIDVAGGDKVPRKGGPGITQSHLLVINKIDLAEAVGADLGVMERDAIQMRRINASFGSSPPSHAPMVFASVKKGIAMNQICEFILDQHKQAILHAQGHSNQ